MAGTTTNHYRFGGQVGYRRDGANRDYVRARNLDTQRGRWVSRDPAGFGAGDANLYRYGEGNPIGRLDPSGLSCGCPCDPKKFQNVQCKLQTGFTKGDITDPGPGPCPNGHDLYVISQICAFDKNGKVSGALSKMKLWRYGPRQAETRCYNRCDCTYDGCTEYRPEFFMMPRIYQHCIWMHERRRAQVCQRTEGISNGGADLGDSTQILTCVYALLKQCNPGSPLIQVCRP